ncbi:hypothetical protein PAXINDRAFT_17951 [Paxillus involutus ATCC 200175]|uniref:Uncharacterized protein n=1 Tax=Paxillus involutus ATCC 200175 TaxID=664439 RepID=A0A0C9TD46_PAXIN|nr:hypothetical protein PAXINDRAFT_17951 [Paxillus involutus ATCC 200175]
MTRTTHPEPPPEPPPTPLHPSPPSPNHYERQDNNDDAETSKTPAQQHADTLHDPGGKTKEPLSVRLEGERDMETSRYVKLMDVKTNNVDAKEDKDNHQPSRNPVGTMDGNKRCPNEPTEPPDEEGEQRGDGELRRAEDVKLKVETRVETVEGVETS